MKSYAQTPYPAKEETECTKQSNYHILGGKHDMDNCTIFNRLLKIEMTLAKKTLCHGCYMPLLQTITPEFVVTEGYVKFVIKSIQLVCMGMCQREETEVTVQLHLQLIL